jgi:DNA-binding NtrC family response regulator
MDINAEVLIVDDDPGLRMALQDRFKHWGCQVSLASDGKEALAICARRSFHMILLDLSMPLMNGMEVLNRLREDGFPGDIVVLTADGSIHRAVEALKAGASDFLTKPADFDLLEQVTIRALDRRRLQMARDALASQAHTNIRAASPAMKELLDLAARVAASDSTVVLTGESGSGKQVISEFIHESSPRKDGPFVYVNCVAISEELIESTLFGHEKGAFTGAISRKPGRLEGAGGGTAFLDEIGDISPKLQTKLLHFLETGEFERVGGNQTVHVDCRIVAATNKDLALEVKEGRFREDLYYRLNVINLRVPPLRERPEDVEILGHHFLEKVAGETKRKVPEFASQTLEAMKRYSWPGNVRQLKNAVERMVVLSSGGVLKPDLLPPEIRTPDLDSSHLGGTDDLDFREAVAGFKRSLLTRALDDCGGNQTKAAEKLGLQRSYLNRLVKDLDLRND